MLHEKTFWKIGLITGLIVWLANFFHLTMWIPFVDVLLLKSGHSGQIASIVLWVVFWVTLTLLARVLVIGQMNKMVSCTKLILNEMSEISPGKDIDRYLFYELPYCYENQVVGNQIQNLYETSRLRQRLLLLNKRMNDHNRSDRIAFLLAGQSEIDASRTESSYGPLRALIWALPGLGFIGTAFEMAQAVGGMGTSLGATSDYLGLRNLLVTNVMPHLGGAFDITLFALSASVVSFFLLTLTHLQEEKLLNEENAISLSLLSKISDERPQLLLNDDNSKKLADGLRDMRLVLQVLANELDQINSFLPDWEKEQ